jgi:hypothetical protein
VLTRAAIEAALNPPDRPRAERLSAKTWLPVLTALTADGLFAQGHEGRATAWTWLGPPDGDVEAEA